MAALRLRRWMVPAAAALLVGVVGVLIAHRGSPPPAFRTAHVQKGTVTQTVDVTGTLQPATEVDLDFGTSGHVATVGVQAGQHVTAGTVLAALDTTAVISALDQSRDALASAQAKLKQDEAGAGNTTEVGDQGAVNTAQGTLGPARINLGDTEQLGQEVVQAAQIALQTALAAAQGQIGADQATVTANQRSLFDVQIAGQQAIALAQATLAQVQAQGQGAVATAQVGVESGRRELADIQRVDGAAVEGAQVQLAAAAALVIVDQRALATDVGQLQHDQAIEHHECTTGPPPHPNCQAAQQNVTADQQRVNADEQELVKDQGGAAIDQTQVTQARARLDLDATQAQQSLATSDVQLRNATLQLATTQRQAQVQLLQAQAQSQSNIDQAQATLAESNIQLQNARVAFQSAQVTNVNQIAQAQTRGVQGNHQAEAQVTGATIQLQNSLAELSALLNGQIPQQVAQDEAQVEADQYQVQTAQDAVTTAQLVAPADGYVEQVNVARGLAIGTATGGAGALAATAASSGPTAGNNGIANLTHAIVLQPDLAYQVSGPVSDAQLQLVHPGDRVDVVPAGVDEQVDGSVTGIAPAALLNSGVATFTVTAVIPGNHPSLHSGATAEMGIVVQEAPDVLTVPTSAIHTSGQATYVLVPHDQKEVAQPVTIGASDPVRTQITSGLKAGDVVIIAAPKSP